MDKNYGGVIWTNHALERLRQRNIKQGDAWSTWKRPESSEYNKSEGVWVYRRNFGNEQIDVVAKQSENGKWLILSVWSKGKNSYGLRKNKNFYYSVVPLFWSTSAVGIIS
jgi:hypothetical protein